MTPTHHPFAPVALRCAALALTAIPLFAVAFHHVDESRELAPGGTWIIPAHVPHSVTAGPSGAMLVEVFVPARDDWADREILEPRPPAGL